MNQTAITEVINIFNSRELALFVWILVFLIWSLLKKNLRTCYGDIITATLHPKILLYFLTMTLYIVLIVLGLRSAGYWQTSMLKDTLLWLLFTGVIIGANSLTTKNEPFIKTTVIESVQAIVLVEFIANTYTFSFWIEIFIIPLMSIVVMMNVISTTDKKYESVEKFTNWIQGLFGLWVLVYSLSSAISDINNLKSLDTVKIFLLPFFLTILFMPYVYILMLYSDYEQLFIRLKFKNKNDIRFINKTKLRIIFNCNLSRKRVKEVREKSWRIVLNGENDLKVLIESKIETEK